MTTEEFIQKAKAIHGDKYDYAKVEYVNKKTKVQIICPEHGAFSQSPEKHLIGQGCPKCGFKKFANSRSIWIKEKCYEVAKDCHSKSELKRLFPYAYAAALRNGWMDDYTWFDILWELKWDRETCYNEALKYTSRGKFKESCPQGYTAARKHGWLDDYTWFNPVRKQVPAGYWTYERCYNEAKKFKSLKEFGEHANGALQYASKMGWTKDYTWFEKPFRWTKELVEEEARKYTSKYDFYTESKNAYGAAVKYGWLDAFDWFEEYRKPNGYWTKARCREEALKYTSKKEFSEGCPAAHAAASRRGWLDEFVWLIDKRIDIINGKIDSVYVYIFDETKAAYVGRTLIRRQKKRDKEHIFNQDSDNVARYAKKHHIPVPPMIILETNLTLKEGLEREDYWRKWYERQGYMMLNKSATGIGKGSLGAISKGKWSRKRCFEEAQKYKSASEFGNANTSAYTAARINGWLDDYVWFVKLWEPKWDKETCYEEAKKYKTRSEFQKGSTGAYNKAIRLGWIDEYVWLMSRKQKPQGYWDNYDNCYKEALKYKNRAQFSRNCQGAYSYALKNGWIDDYTWFDEKQKHNYWNRETCFEEAKKYKTSTEFARNAVRAYELARKKRWLSDYTWFEKPFRWTKELCEKEARKYTKRSHFKKGSPAAYTNARENGWLEEYTWFEEKPRMNYWNKETCYEEAKKYKTRTEFQKGNTSAYAVALKNGWIDEYEWFKPTLRIWTYDDCKKEARKYQSRIQFKHAVPGAYKKAQEQGWLDKFYPVPLRRVLDHDTCKVLVTRYASVNELRKKDRSLFKTLKMKGWLDEFFPKGNIE